MSAEDQITPLLTDEWTDSFLDSLNKYDLGLSEMPVLESTMLSSTFTSLTGTDVVHSVHDRIPNRDAEICGTSEYMSDVSDNGILFSTIDLKSLENAIDTVSSPSQTTAINDVSTSTREIMSNDISSAVQTKNILEFSRMPDVINQLIVLLRRDIERDWALVQNLKMLMELFKSRQHSLSIENLLSKKLENQLGLKSSKSIQNLMASKEPSENSSIKIEPETVAFPQPGHVEKKKTRNRKPGRSKNKHITLCSLDNDNAISYCSNPSQTLSNVKKGKTYKCVDCDFRTNHLKNLNGHLLSRHRKGILGLKTYNCNYCDYKCADKQRFIEHELTHTRMKHFTCADCGKEFSTKRGLRTHMQYHSSERPYTCDYCESSFKVKAKLRDHVKLMHTNKGEKPYQCGYCNHRASVRGNVNQHIKNMHKGNQLLVKIIQN